MSDMLFKHQITAINLMKQHERVESILNSSILYLQSGYGKTRIMLNVIADDMMKCKDSYINKTVVVVNRPVLWQWEREIALFDTLNPYIITSKKDIKNFDRNSEHNIVIVTDTMCNIFTSKYYKWKRFVFDDIKGYKKFVVFPHYTWVITNDLTKHPDTLFSTVTVPEIDETDCYILPVFYEKYKNINIDDLIELKQLDMFVRYKTTGIEQELEILKAKRDDDITCCICLEDSVNPVVDRNCKNMYCYDCLKEWSKNQGMFSCPMCRREITMKTVIRNTTTGVARLLKLLKNKNGKFIFYTDDEKSIATILRKYKVNYFTLKIPVKSVNNKFKKYVKKGSSVNALLITPKDNGWRGLDLKETTDIIISGKLVPNDVINIVSRIGLDHVVRVHNL